MNITSKKNNYPENSEALSFQIREAYKAARTNIDYSIIKKGCKTIAFTSSTKSEGKTMSAVNVASAFAQQVNTRVLVVDCDLRRPRIHTVLGVTLNVGLADYLNNKAEFEDIIMDTKIQNLKAVCYGLIPPNPSELLSSDAMQQFIKLVQSKFDYVIFDTPPINVVIDALPVVKEVDGVVIVVKAKSTTYASYNKATETLERAGAKVLGVVINKIQPAAVRKGGGYLYGGYGYY